MASDDTHRIARRSASSAPMRVRVVKGPNAGLGVSVDRELVIGTSEHADLHLSDRTVSRRHLILSPSAGGVHARDAGSVNGTFHGELRVFDAELPDGAELRIGETVLRVEVDRFPPEAAVKMPERFGRFIGRARCLAPLYAKLERAAPSEATVLIEGESGTGKELLAEAIHEHSPRAGGPFVVVDCGAVPETLIESELFGHEKGAFTGADRRRIGAFEQANGGTCFLDEIGELPLNIQTRLLRVLDRRQIRPLGGEETLEIDVRVIAATNRNLELEVEESRFRVDLFHRLAVVSLRVPPLRARLEDLELLADHLSNGKSAGLPFDRLRAYHWPGNVRELRNYVERYCLFGETTELSSISSSADPIVAFARSGAPYRQAREQVIEAFTTMYVEDMLSRHGNNVSQAARAAGIARRHFHRLKSARSTD